MTLMQQMAASGELEHLVPERVWAEFADALSCDQPGVFIGLLRESGALTVLLPEVDCLFGVPQTEKYHPEIDTGVHVMMAMDMAARLGGPTRVVFTLLLHDLGKGLTPSARLPSHFGHEKGGLPLVNEVCARLRVPGAFRELALLVCELHLRCHRLLEAQPPTVMKLIEEADLLRRPERVQDFVRACEADYRGRKGLDDRPYPQGDRLQAALRAVLAIRAKDIGTEGLDGIEIGEKLRQARVEAIAGAADPAG
jgi:tRNA nucleotidyltransferase (CCA-adding enzyme)